MYAGVIILDGNRARFSVPDWKAALALKVLRARLRDLLTRSFRMPGRLPTAQQEKWLDTWQRIFSQDFGGDRDRDRSATIGGGGAGSGAGAAVAATVGGGNGGGDGGGDGSGAGVKLT